MIYLKYLSEGYRSIVYLHNNYIILKGKNKESYNTYKNDLIILNKISKYIKSIKIPSEVKLIKRNLNYPYGGLKYKLIEENVFNYLNKDKYNLDNIAFKLSSFLNELHSIPINYNKEEIINKEKELIEKNIKLLVNYLDSNYLEKINKFKKEYYSYFETYCDYSLIHGDLWYENYIFSNDLELVGVIDFEKSCIFMREYDFVPLLYIGNNLLEKTIKHYKYDFNLRLINLLFIRRELVSFEYILNYEKEDTSEQIEKIIDKIDRYL